MAEKTIKINGKDIPCKDVIEIKMVMVSDTIMYDVTYNDFDPCYHRMSVLLPKDKGYALEKKVRKTMNKR